MATFSKDLEEAIHRALALASERRHELATLEHLLLALADDPDAKAVMKASNVDIAVLKRDLLAHIENDLISIVSDAVDEAKPTTSFQRVIQRALIHVETSGRDEVTGANIIIALFAERESHALYFLREQDMTRFDAVNYVSHGISKNGTDTERRVPRGADEEGEEAKQGPEALEAYCVDLNVKARKGKIDPLIGRGKGS